MKVVDYCVNCGNTDVRSSSAGLNNFVIDRMLGRPKEKLGFTACKSLRCKTCEFTSIDIRFTLEEECRYYTNYMKDEYINHRFLYDNYKEHLTPFNSKEYKDLRRNTLDEIITSILDIKKINSVLDFGGDTGDLIPESLKSSKKYLLDIENRNSLDDVTVIKDVSESGPVDLIICAHTFEHVSYPRDLLEVIKTFMNGDTYLYIEVPNELNHSFNFHEHINQYNIKSLKTLLEKSNMIVIESGEVFYPAYIGNAFYVIGMLC